MRNSVGVRGGVHGVVPIEVPLPVGDRVALRVLGGGGEDDNCLASGLAGAISSAVTWGGSFTASATVISFCTSVSAPRASVTVRVTV